MTLWHVSQIVFSLVYFIIIIDFIGYWWFWMIDWLLIIIWISGIGGMKFVGRREVKKKE